MNQIKELTGTQVEIPRYPPNKIHSPPLVRPSPFLSWDNFFTPRTRPTQLISDAGSQRGHRKTVVDHVILIIRPPDVTRSGLRRKCNFAKTELQLDERLQRPSPSRYRPLNHHQGAPIADKNAPSTSPSFRLPLPRGHDSVLLLRHETKRPSPPWTKGRAFLMA